MYEKKNSKKLSFVNFIAIKLVRLIYVVGRGSLT